MIIFNCEDTLASCCYDRHFDIQMVYVFYKVSNYMYYTFTCIVIQ